MRTPLTDQFGIEHPIIQAPMNWATDARLVATVSAAGGLGTLGPNAGASTLSSDPEVAGARLREQINQVRTLTGNPFAVNVPVGRGDMRVFSDMAVRVACEERVPIVIVATGDPEVYTAALKAEGITVVHAVASVRHARKAQKAGVDAVVAEGFDGGGHSGFAETPSMTLTRSIARAIDLPVIAAGGIVDGVGLAAACVAGAQAAYMGTRFMAVEESPIHPLVKAAIVQADDTSTISWGRTTEVARTLANDFAVGFRRREAAGTSSEDLHAYIADYAASANRRIGGLLEGDLKEGEIYMGTGAGLIDEVLHCTEVVDRSVVDAREVVARLHETWNADGDRAGLLRSGRRSPG